MAFEDSDVDPMPDDPMPNAENSNRAFLIAAGVLGALALLAVIVIAGWAVFVRPRLANNSAQRASLVQTVNAQNTQVVMAITQTSSALEALAQMAPTSTATPTQVVAPLATATPTSVVVIPTFTRPPTQDMRTATVAALMTQAAVATRTVNPTSTALPQTGFADEVGLPVMMGMALVLVGVIFLARRLRTV